MLFLYLLLKKLPHVFSFVLGGLWGGEYCPGRQLHKNHHCNLPIQTYDTHDKLLNKTFFLSTFSWTGIERLKDARDAIVDRRTQGMPHGTP